MREWEFSLASSHGTEALSGSPAVTMNRVRVPAEGKEISPSEVWPVRRPEKGAEIFSVWGESLLVWKEYLRHWSPCLKHLNKYNLSCHLPAAFLASSRQ